MKIATVINIFGAPCSGKSTISAGIFYELKLKHQEVEIITEYAKDLVWVDNLKTLNNQIYVFAKQYHKQWRLKDKVDFIITDSPLLLSIIYDSSKCDILKQLVLKEFSKFNNINIFLKRTDSVKFSSNGRTQSTIEEANKIELEIQNLLDESKLRYYVVDSNEKTKDEVLKILKKELVIN